MTHFKIRLLSGNPLSSSEWHVKFATFVGDFMFRFFKEPQGTRSHYFMTWHNPPLEGRVSRVISAVCINTASKRNVNICQSHVHTLSGSIFLLDNKLIKIFFQKLCFTSYNCNNRLDCSQKLALHLKNTLQRRPEIGIKHSVLLT